MKLGDPQREGSVGGHRERGISVGTGQAARAPRRGGFPAGRAGRGAQRRAPRWGFAFLLSFILAPRSRWRGLRGAFSVFPFSDHPSVAVYLIVFWV